MAKDNPKKRGSPDKDLVATKQAHELRDWPDAFDCTERELVLARMVLNLMGDPHTPPNYRRLLAEVDREIGATKAAEARARRLPVLPLARTRKRRK